VEELTTIGNFLVLQELGHGGMGAVFIGYEATHRRLVVIKTLFEQWAKEENMVKRFVREAAVYQKLNHPNIVRFIDSGCDSGTHFIAMEYIKSRALDEVLKSGGRLPVNTAVKIMGHLTDAVSHAHEKNIIHRDLKPQNVMYSEDGVVKLLDFGIAHTEDDLIKTQEGSILGTFYYAAPEQNQGKKVDERSDLYSLGAILYEMLTGKRPISGSSLLEVTRAQIMGGIIAPSVFNPEVPKGLEKIILKLLEKDPNNRYQTARELIFDLQKFREDPKGFDPTRMFDDEETETKWEKAKEAYNKKNYDFALDLAKGVAQAKTDSPEVFVLLGKIYAAKNFKKPALDAFKKALATDPESTQNLLDYGIALYSLREWDEAEATIKKVLELEPENMYASRYVKLIADARIRPPPAAGAGPGFASSPTQRQDKASEVRAAPQTPGKGPAVTLSAPESPEQAAARVKRLTRLWWGYGYWKTGQRGKGVVWSLIEALILASLLFPLAYWPTFHVDFAATAQGFKDAELKATFQRWHDQKLDVHANDFLNSPLRWVTVSLSLILFLLGEAKLPLRVREQGPDGRGSPGG